MVDGVNRITGTDTADTLSSTPGDDAIVANAGADTIYARASDDTVGGGVGSDRLIVNLFNHTLFPVTPTGAEKYTIGIDAIIDRSGTLNKHFTSIEQITLVDTISPSVTVDASGFTGNLNVTSGSGDDVLTGGSGYNYLAAGLGSNTIDGGSRSRYNYSTADLSLDTTVSMPFLSIASTSGSTGFYHTGDRLVASYTNGSGTFTSTVIDAAYVAFRSGLVDYGLQIDASNLINQSGTGFIFLTATTAIRSSGRPEPIPFTTFTTTFPIHRRRTATTS